LRPPIRGKPSLGWRGRRAAERISERVSSALPGSDDAAFDADFGELGDKIVHGLHVGPSAAANWPAPPRNAVSRWPRKRANAAKSWATPPGAWAEFADTALARGSYLADEQSRGSHLADVARERVGEGIDDARKGKWKR